ncbi:hypothetical protein HQO82_13665 [Rhodococcus fascians]|nr:hypothetical protein [Rhodococcus fascians]MBY4114872.1 hypothetical protein [Rhodococcus fascians]
MELKTATKQRQRNNLAGRIGELKAGIDPNLAEATRADQRPHQVSRPRSTTSAKCCEKSKTSTLSAHRSN